MRSGRNGVVFKPWGFLAVTVFVLTLGVSSQAGTPNGSTKGNSNWRSDPPALANNPQVWSELMSELYDRGLYYGALTVASRMLLFFPDVPSKESAYKMIIQVVDRGYDFPVTPLFLAGDIEPVEDRSFVNNYNFYKYQLNHEKGLDRWAKSYYENIEREKFPKYLFYTAVQAYNDNKMTEAEDILKKIIDMDLPEDQLPLIKKVNRTLARIYFEKSEYEKSLEIYDRFLLRLNPMTPSDWLEAAWNLFYLKKYQEALGYLYNLESKSAAGSLSLEKYTIRGLIYRNLCVIDQANSLSDSFEKEFGAVIMGIKLGKPLNRFPILSRLEVAGNGEFQRISLTSNELQREAQNLNGLSSDQKKVANFVYRSELQLLTRNIAMYSNEATARVAAQLIELHEKLRFLKFDVTRQKFNPDLVFKLDDHKDNNLLERSEKDSIEIQWKQFGDYWRDERLKFKSDIQNRCAE